MTPSLARTIRSLAGLRDALERWPPADRMLVGTGLLHHEARKFLVVTRARAGSNLLISTLRSHPEIHAEGELLQRVAGTSIDAVLDRFYSKARPRTIAAVGFKVFYYHPLDGDSDAAWDRIASIPDLSFVHLKRQNRLRTITSRRIADQTARWVDAGPAPPALAPGHKQVTFTRRELVKAFEHAAAFEQAFEERVTDRPVLELAYEDLVAHPARETKRLTQFLGVGDAPVRAATRRQNPEPLSQLITNYDELAQEFRATPWSAFFDG